MKLSCVSLRRNMHLSSVAPRITATVALLLAALLVAAGGPAWAGIVRNFEYRSSALGQDQVAQIYVPDGPAPPGGWPTLYLLHGLDGAATDWQTLGGLQTTMDRLIAERRIAPMLVVMPPGGNSWYVDSAEVQGPGDYATAIALDLTQAVEAAFPVGHDRAHRGVAGISMGGFGALRLGLSRPERYVAVAAISPAIWQNIPAEDLDKPEHYLQRLRTSGYFRKADPTDVTVGLDLPPEGRHFGTAFGTPFDPRRFNAANVFTLLQTAVDALMTMPRIYLTVGDDDSHLLWRAAIAFFETMQMDGRDIEFRVTDGDHNWTCWRASLSDAILFMGAQFRRAQLQNEAVR